MKPHIALRTMLAMLGLMGAPSIVSAQQLATGPAAKQVQIKPGRVEMMPLAKVPFADPAQVDALLALGQAQRSQGWIAAREGQSQEIDGYFENERTRARLRPALSDVIGKLRVAPMPLERTFLDSAKMVGAMPAGGYVNGGWTGLARAMEIEGVGRVVLEEYDYAQAGSYIVVPEELSNFQINGLPGQFSVWKAPNGRTWTQLRWFTASKEFRLFIGREVREGDSVYQDMMRLAALAQ